MSGSGSVQTDGEGLIFCDTRQECPHRSLKAFALKGRYRLFLANFSEHKRPRLYQINLASVGRSGSLDLSNEEERLRGRGNRPLFIFSGGTPSHTPPLSYRRRVDGEFLMKKETEFQEKEQEVGDNATAKAAKARKKARNDSVVEKGKGKGKAAVVAGGSSKSAKQKGKEVVYDLLLCIFAYFNSIYSSLLLWT